MSLLENRLQQARLHLKKENEQRVLFQEVALRKDQELRKLKAEIIELENRLLKNATYQSREKHMIM